MTDQEILKLFRAEKTKEKAFTSLVNVYSKKMYWHIRRIVNDHDDANDVVQNVFIKVWKALPNFKEESTLYTWLYRIATNEAITFINSKKRMHKISIDDEEAGSSATLRDDGFTDGEEITKKLECAIDSLPAKQKQVFILRYYDEMKYEDMEKMLGTSAGALKASFHHAVKKIEIFLTGD